MQMRLPSSGRFASVLLSMCTFGSLPSVAIADGGAVRLLERIGNYQIAVFTAPTPLRAGPSISVYCSRTRIRMNRFQRLGSRSKRFSRINPRRRFLTLRHPTQRPTNSFRQPPWTFPLRAGGNLRSPSMVPWERCRPARSYKSANGYRRISRSGPGYAGRSYRSCYLPSISVLSDGILTDHPCCACHACLCSRCWMQRSSVEEEP